LEYGDSAPFFANTTPKSGVQTPRSETAVAIFASIAEFREGIPLHLTVAV